MSFDAILPYQPTPLPSAVVGGTVTLTFRLLGKTLNECFPQDLFSYGVWTQNDGTKISVQHVKIVTVNPGDCTLVASGVVNNSGFMETWYEYTHTIDTGTLTNPIGSGAWATGYYSLCYGQNGRHDGIHFREPNIYAAWGFAGDYYRNAFILTPEPLEIDDGPTNRTDTHSRVAGERAIYEDEFFTRDQLEAGSGIVFRYRDESGAVVASTFGSRPMFYPAIADRRMNVIIEAPVRLQLQVNNDNIGPPDTEIMDFLFVRKCDPDSYNWPVMPVITDEGDGERHLSFFSQDFSQEWYDYNDHSIVDLNIWVNRVGRVNVDSQGQTSTDIPVNFELAYTGGPDIHGICPGEVRLRGWVPDTHVPYSYYLGINTETIGGGAVEISNGELVRIVAGTNVTVSKTGNDVTINATGGTGSSSWNLGIEEDPAQNIADTDTIRLIAGPDMIIKRIY